MWQVSETEQNTNAVKNNTFLQPDHLFFGACGLLVACLFVMLLSYFHKNLTSFCVSLIYCKKTVAISCSFQVSLHLFQNVVL